MYTPPSRYSFAARQKSALIGPSRIDSKKRAWRSPHAERRYARQSASDDTSKRRPGLRSIHDRSTFSGSTDGSRAVSSSTGGISARKSSDADALLALPLSVTRLEEMRDAAHRWCTQHGAPRPHWSDGNLQPLEQRGTSHTAHRSAIGVAFTSAIDGQSGAGPCGASAREVAAAGAAREEEAPRSITTRL